MSRIGKKPIVVPEGVTVSLDDRLISVTGARGDLSFRHAREITVTVQSGQVIVTRSSDERQARSLHGLTRALVANMVTGVSEGFSRQLNFIGVGYTAEQKGSNILMNLGYSHPIYFQPPPGIDLEVSNRNTTVTVKGIDKQLVGQVAAKIREQRKPEPYKGKGVRYSNEFVRRKAGKTVGGGT